MPLDYGTIVTGENDPAVWEAILDFIIQVANGEKHTKAEYSNSWGTAMTARHVGRGPGFINNGSNNGIEESRFLLRGGYADQIANVLGTQLAD